MSEKTQIRHVRWYPTKILTEVEYVCLDFSKIFAESGVFVDKNFDV
jgi:hypothetical protein